MQEPVGVCIIVENMSVPADRRVWREAQALTEAGYRVSIICPKMPGFTRSYEKLSNIEIYRHRAWEGDHPGGYFLEYLWALTMEVILAIRVYRRTRFQILQACNPPDTMFLIALLFKLLGVRFIFDQHDPVPEYFEARYQGRGLLYWLVCMAERLTFRVADISIVTNESCRQLAIERGKVPSGKCFVVRNCPDLNDFRLPPPNPVLKEGHAKMALYVGVMGTQDGIGLLLDSIDVLVNRKQRRDTLFVLVGSGAERREQEARAIRMGLDKWVRFTGTLYGDSLRAYFASADVGMSPDPSNPFNDKLTMVKILEYMACGLPVVLYDLVEGHRSAGDAALYARNNDPVEFAELMEKLLGSEPLRQELGRVGRQRIEEQLNWTAEKVSLLEAYRCALGKPTKTGSAHAADGVEKGLTGVRTGHTARVMASTGHAAAIS